MKSITNTIKIEALFNEEQTHRYSLHKVWDKEKPQALIISKAAGNDDGISETLTQSLITNNLYALGYGGFCLCNLFSSIDGKQSDKDNLKTIKALCAKDFNDIIVCWGNLSASSEEIKTQEKTVTKILAESKKNLLTVTNGKFINCHPLHPSVRKKFILAPFPVESEATK